MSVEVRNESIKYEIGEYLEKDWPKMARSQLIEAAGLRGLSVHGSRDKLVERMMIYMNDVKSGVLDGVRYVPTERQVPAGGEILGRPLAVVISQPIEPILESTKNREKKKKDSKKAIAADRQKRRMINQSGMDEEGGVLEVELASDAEVSKNRRKRPVSDSEEGEDSASDSSDNEGEEESSAATKRIDNSTAVQKTDEQKFASRKNLVRKALTDYLDMFGEMKVDKIPDVLANKKIKNFKPELLNYKRVEDWLTEEDGESWEYDIVSNSLFLLE